MMSSWRKVKNGREDICIRAIWDIRLAVSHAPVLDDNPEGGKGYLRDKALL